MSKDKVNDRSFPDRLKRWFRLGDRGNLTGGRDIRLTEELRAELGSEAAVSTRMRAIRELTEVLATKRLEENGVEKLWLLVQDLVSRDTPQEQRHLTLTMLTGLCTTHERLGPMRHVFFNYISNNYQHEDTKPMFEFFSSVISEGKQLEYIEEFVGPFLHAWLPNVLASPKASDALNLLFNLVKFNAAYLDEYVVTGYVKQVVILLQSANSEPEAQRCLQVLDTVQAYSHLPSQALPSFIRALTRAVNVPSLTAETWKIMKNLLGTHLGNSGLYVLCRLIQTYDDPCMVRGAIYFITSALWGKNKVPSLSYKPAAVLPTIHEAANSEHPIVVYEVALSMQKLVGKMSLDLHLSSWDLILDILGILFQHPVVRAETVEGSTIMVVLKETLDVIEQLIDQQLFGGSHDKFFDLIDLYSHLRPESSVLRLLDHQAKQIDPVHPHWLSNLGTLLHRYYRTNQHPNIRTKSLAILSDVYNNNRYLYGKEMVESVVLTQLEGIEQERDVGVRTAAVNLMVHIVLTQKTSVVPDILIILEKIVMAPYLMAGDIVQVVRESEAADILAAINGLIRIFKKKLWELPSKHAIQTYSILLKTLEQHYRNQTVLEGVSQVRLQIFEMIFQMRADSKYRLGFPRHPQREDNGGIGDQEEEDPVWSLLPHYSPYILVDHRHGQKLVHSGHGSEDKVIDESSILGQHSPRQSLYSKVDHRHGQKLSAPLDEPAPKDEDGAVDEFTNNDAEEGYCPDESFEATADATTAGLRMPGKVEVTPLSLTQAAMVVIVAMKKEKDWEVLRLILECVPQVLQNKALILSKDGNDIDYLAAALYALISDRSLGLPESLHNTPAKFTKSDFQAYVFPVLATLASYHMHLEPLIQQKVIKCLEMGVLSRVAGPLCVSALTLCVLEMRDTMMRLLPKVMINLSKISATIQNAQPILEFLSTLLHLPKVYANFVSDQYMSIFAIAIPYTNLFKFNHYIVSLAYHVIAMWFLKCRLPFRKHFVSFISKNLSMILTNEEAAQRRRSASANEQEQAKNEADKINFHNDLRETCNDLMARYTFASCAPTPKRSAVAEMLVSGGQSQTWIVGNKLITVTTSGCSQRPMKHGLCDKCLQLCNLDKKTAAPEPSYTSSPSMSSRRRHRSEFHRTISHEAKFKPQSKDDLHMRSYTQDNGDSLAPLIDQVGTSVSWASTNAAGSDDAFGPEVELDRLASYNCTTVTPPSSTTNTTGPTVTSATATNSGSTGGPEGGGAVKREERHLCACWCQGWAEIYIRQSTGNMSWMMRVQNQQTLVNGSSSDLPLHDLSILFSPQPPPPSSDLIRTLLNKKIDTDNMDDEKYQELLEQHFEEPRPRAFSGTSDKTQDSDPGSLRGDSSGWSSSNAPSQASSDQRLHSTEPGDNTRGNSPLIVGNMPDGSVENPDDPRLPVQRCHSSPEMSEGVLVGDAGEEVNSQQPQALPTHAHSPSPLNTEIEAPHSPLGLGTIMQQDSSEPKLYRTNTMGSRPRPRLDGMHEGSGSVGSTSPPPATSMRVRHASAFQTNSVGSLGGSGSPGSPRPMSHDLEDDEDGSPKPMRRGRGHTISDMNPASRKLQVRAAVAARKISNQQKENKGGISPSFVFLQLYYHGNLGSGPERPLLVPQAPEMQRALRVLDLIQPQETHKIGVLYIAPGQTNEQQILSNTCGSLRYMHFLQGLGSVLELSEVVQEEIFLGGLDVKGIDGSLVYIWHDDVMQVVFHVATLMPTRESDPKCNGKKRHIGNDYVTIVYNESGHPYNINTIKGQFNHTVVEVVPQGEDHSTNSVGVLCKPELSDFVGGNAEARLVSDTNLPILVRQLALHADLASMIWESLKRPPKTPYASNWLERLRKIRKIRQMVLKCDDRPQEQETSGSSFDFTDMIEQDKTGDKDKGRSGGSFHQFLS